MFQGIFPSRVEECLHLIFILKLEDNIEKDWSLVKTQKG